MNDLKSVIQGLECRLDIDGSKYKHCLSCNYRHDIDHCEWACKEDDILKDALSILKAPPRVMTLGEIMKCGDAEIMYLETGVYEKDIKPAIFQPENTQE